MSGSIRRTVHRGIRILAFCVALVFIAAQDDPVITPCSHNPKGGQLKCECKRDQLPCADGRRPPATGGRAECSSWCHENYCLCPRPCEEPEHRAK